MGFFVWLVCFLGFFNIIIIFFLFLKTKPQTALILSGSKASMAPFVQTHPLLPSRTSALRNEAVALFQPNHNKSHLAACNSFPTQCNVQGLLLRCELRTKLFTFTSTLPPVQAWDSLEKSGCYERGGRVPLEDQTFRKNRNNINADFGSCLLALFLCRWRKQFGRRFKSLVAAYS